MTVASQAESALNSIQVRLIRGAITVIGGPLAVAFIYWAASSLSDIKGIVVSHSDAISILRQDVHNDAEAIKAQVDALGAVKETAAKTAQKLDDLASGGEKVERKVDAIWDRLGDGSHPAWPQPHRPTPQ